MKATLKKNIYKWMKKKINKKWSQIEQSSAPVNSDIYKLATFQSRHTGSSVQGTKRSLNNNFLPYITCSNPLRRECIDYDS